MRKLLLIAVITIAFVNSTSAQQSSTEVMSVKEVKVNNTKYVVRRSQTGNTFIDPASFINQANGPSPLGTEPPPFQNKDDKGLMKAFYEVFNKERLEKLLPEKSILIVFNVNAETGRIISTSYMLKKNSRITLNEVDLLSAALKKHVIFLFNKRDLKAASQVTLTHNLSIRKIIAGSMILR